ncbi:putative nucleic acid-binding Zn ribbon protein [Pedobacter sp. UYEF25]
MRKPNDVSVKDAIDKMLDVYRLRKKFDETSIVALWPELMGAAVANRTTQIYIHDKKLFIRLESSVIKNELLMVRHGIIQKLNEKAGTEVISEIVFL